MQGDIVNHPCAHLAEAPGLTQKHVALMDEALPQIGDGIVGGLSVTVCRDDLLLTGLQVLFVGATLIAFEVDIGRVVAVLNGQTQTLRQGAGG